MRSLEKWQVISFISRTTAMLLGIIQSFVIVRILTVGEFGVVQLAVAIGGAFGIYQHLGLAAGSTREISAADDEEDIFKIFVTSAVVRYSITIPIAIGLFFLADNIAIERYGEPGLITPLKIFAVVILIQAIQSILNAVIAGTKRFKQLFTYQIIIAAVSVMLYIPLVYLYGINGYFYAMLAFNIIASTTLTIIAFRPMRAKIVFPSWADFKRVLKALISISLAVYLVKVLFTMWEKSGPILLGLSVPIEAVGIYAFALLYAKKLTHVSDSITDVNLPVFSEKFTHNIDEFKVLFGTNFNKVFAVIVLAAFSAIFWSQELITFVVGGSKYDASFPLIMPLVFTFVFYSLINIFQSSIYVPGKFVRDMIIGYVLLLLVTVGVYYGATKFTTIDYLKAMTYGMLIGAIFSFVFMVVASELKLKFTFFNYKHIFILVLAFAISHLSSIDGFVYKSASYVLFVALYFLCILLVRFITRDELKVYFGMLRSKLT